MSVSVYGELVVTLGGGLFAKRKGGLPSLGEAIAVRSGVIFVHLGIAGSSDILHGKERSVLELWISRSYEERSPRQVRCNHEQWLGTDAITQVNIIGAEMQTVNTCRELVHICCGRYEAGLLHDPDTPMASRRSRLEVEFEDESYRES